MLMKPIIFHDRKMLDAVTSGEAYIEIDNRKFMLFEVEEVLNPGIYEVRDNPILSDSEIDLMLGISSEK
jgi:hypothetical protein